MIRVLREVHEAPQEVQEVLASCGGLNPYGEPNYRAVWGWNRLTWIGGRWEDHDGSGNLTGERIELRQVPKYTPFDRWHIERWTPPEKYGSPSAWYSQTIESEDGIRIPALGLYPRRGEYEHCYTCEDDQKNYIPITPRIARVVVQLAEASRQFSLKKRREAIEEVKRREEKRWDSDADTILNDSEPFDGRMTNLTPLHITEVKNQDKQRRENVTYL